MLGTEKDVRRIIRKVLLEEYVTKTLLEKDESRFTAELIIPGGQSDGGKSLSKKIRDIFQNDGKIYRLASGEEKPKKNKKEDILNRLRNLRKVKSDFEMVGSRFQRHPNLITYIEVYIEEIEGETSSGNKDGIGQNKVKMKAEKEAHKVMSSEAKKERQRKLQKFDKEDKEAEKELEKAKKEKGDDKDKTKEKEEKQSSTISKIDDKDLKTRVDDAKKQGKGSNRKLIENIQEALNTIEYTDYAGKKLEKDGDWGQRTRSALSKLIYNNHKTLGSIFGKTISDKDREGLRTRKSGGRTGGTWKKIVRELSGEKLSYLAALVVLNTFTEKAGESFVGDNEGPAKDRKSKKKSSPRRGGSGGKTPKKGKPEASQKELTPQEKEELQRKIDAAAGNQSGQQGANQSTANRPGIQGILDREKAERNKTPEEIKADRIKELKKMGIPASIIKNPPNKRLYRKGKTGSVKYQGTGFHRSDGSQAYVQESFEIDKIIAAYLENPESDMGKRAVNIGKNFLDKKAKLFYDQYGKNPVNRGGITSSEARKEAIKKMTKGKLTLEKNTTKKLDTGDTAVFKSGTYYLREKQYSGNDKKLTKYFYGPPLVSLNGKPPNRDSGITSRFLKKSGELMKNVRYWNFGPMKYYYQFLMTLYQKK